MKPSTMMWLGIAAVGGYLLYQRSQAATDQRLVAGGQANMENGAQMIAREIAGMNGPAQTQRIVGVVIQMIGNNAAAIRQYAPTFLEMLARLGVSAIVLANARTQLGI